MCEAETKEPQILAHPQTLSRKKKKIRKEGRKGDEGGRENIKGEFSSDIKEKVFFSRKRTLKTCLYYPVYI
jgi:hypothetical protein